MNKRSLVILLIAVLLIGGIGGYLVYANMQTPPAQNPVTTLPTPTPIPTPTPAPTPAPVVFDPLNATYTIENTPVTLVNGKAETGTAENKVSTSIFGQPVVGDLNGDGQADAAVFITQNLNGSGVFYYAAAAVNMTHGAHGTNTVFLGDRIAPQNIQIQNGQMTVNYADRKPTDSMVTPPSVGVSVNLTLDGTTLQKIVAPATTISYLFSKEDPTKFCNGEDMDSAGYQKTITAIGTTTTSETHPTNAQIIKATLNLATTGMCRTVLNQLAITENAGTVTIPPIEGWAGISIAMCTCKPQVEVNILRIPGMKKVVWQ